MSLHPRRRALRVQLATIVWLTVVWELLWGGLSVANILSGVVIAVVLTRLLPMPPIEFQGRIHVLSLLYLIVRFHADIFLASIQVAWAALRPGPPPRGAVLGVQLRSHSDLYLTMVAEMTTLVPGSVVVEAHRVTGVLYVHWFDVTSMDDVEKARAEVLATEARVLRALGSDAELAAAGLTRRPVLRRVIEAARSEGSGSDGRADASPDAGSRGGDR